MGVVWALPVPGHFLSMCPVPGTEAWHSGAEGWDVLCPHRPASVGGATDLIHKAEVISNTEDTKITLPEDLQGR